VTGRRTSRREDKTSRGSSEVEGKGSNREGSGIRGVIHWTQHLIEGKQSNNVAQDRLRGCKRIRQRGNKNSTRGSVWPPKGGACRSMEAQP